MKGRVIVIDMPQDRASQAALIVDGRLEDLLLDPPRSDTTPKPGEIYWAKVDRLVPAIGGAFVKLTPDHQGFLRETKGVKQGQQLLVQVSSYPEPGKATPVTTRVLYKGPRIILTPERPGINVSRRIKDPNEQARLTGILGSADRVDAGCDSDGYIVRTAAAHSDAEELLAERLHLLAMRESTARARQQDAPRAGIGVATASAKALAEWYDTDLEMIATSDRAEQVLGARNRDHGPSDLWGSELLAQHLTTGDGDPFDHFGVWDEIERLKSPRADLPSGGWMAIEATRAMVTVDVNTGDGFGAGDAMTTNIEAARELPRQLRLRGLGGQITIDFAPLKKMHRKKLEETLKQAFRRDPIDTSLAGWTPLGNFELQRKRERRPLAELLPL